MNSNSILGKLNLCALTGLMAPCLTAFVFPSCSKDDDDDDNTYSYSEWESTHSD